MVQSSARCSHRQNLYDGKDELAGRTLTKVSDCCTPFPAATRALTPASAPVVAPFAVFGSADSSVVRYSEDDLQRILRTVLDFRPLAPVPAPVVAAPLHFKGPREQCLKARFSDIYWGKTHLKCYNFFQQCKDHFNTTGAIGPNRVPFATIFLKDIALFRWQ